ncbi:hypothetical protein BJ170DRAFT_592136 [Xylariales sp. AK1849]|nr:hypothetical protein BJ170DRAFT_592136 [Xylariales sp. AK1849]
MATEVTNPKGKAKEGEEKPLPTPRPGTSGTENLLITNRRQASEQFVKAQRAEKAYRAKKHASLARHNYNDTKTHFKESFSHFRLGMNGLFSIVKATPYLIGEKREDRRKRAETTKRQRDLEKKKKLEEVLARDSTASEDDKPEES